jgi:IS1 family transposase
METCPHCQASGLRKYGLAPNGKQRFICRSCGRTSRSSPGQGAYSDVRKAEILRAYQERTSLRGLTRIFGVSRQTVTAWLKKAQQLPPLSQTLQPARPVDGLELDELCTFVGRKQRKVWLWLALCRRTARKLWRRLPPEYRRAWCYTDLWEAYTGVVPWRQHLPATCRGTTNHIERFNATLRARLGRLVRKSLSFSRSLKLLDACVHLFLHSYNATRTPT